MQRITGMMRIASLTLAVIATFAAVGCSSSAPPKLTPTKLFWAYMYSTNVKNDVFPGMRTKADRLANLASYGTPDDLADDLFSSYRCDNDSDCQPGDAVTKTARSISGTFYQRYVLVKHLSGRLELMPLYIAIKAGGSTSLIDRAGRAYPGGLDEFRAHNNLLSNDDLLLLGIPFTKTTGKFHLQVVTGHTRAPVDPFLWLYPLIALVAIAGVGLISLRSARTSQSVDSHN